MSVPAPLFPPTLREVLLRPKWIGVLALCLVVAGVFAWLGQWQLASAIDTDPPEDGATEVVRPLADVVAPGDYLLEEFGGQRVTIDGDFAADDFYVVSSRYNDGEAGYWVTGQLRVTEPEASIAVAVGFTPEREVADATAAALNVAPPQDVTITGRVIDDEGTVAPSRSQPITEMARMSPATLLNFWNDVDGRDVYRPYLTSDEAYGELESIHSPAPDLGSNINWLNIFYAAEWVIFAGFAFYLWYRLAKDEWERELEELEEASA